MKILKIGIKDCAECKVMSPRFEEIEKEYPWLKTEYFEITSSSKIVKKYNILSAPTFIFLDKQGNEILRMIDIIDKDVLVKAILDNEDE